MDGVDKSRCQSGVGQQWHVEVDGGAAYLVAVAQLLACQVFRDVDHNVDFFVVEHLECLRCLPDFARPVHADCRYVVVDEILICTAGGVDFVAHFVECGCCIEHVGFLLGRTCAEQHRALRNLVAYREHRLEDCFGGVVAEATHFARRRHVDSEHRVGALQTREGELRRFDADVVEVEGATAGTLYVDAEHYARCQVDKVDFEHFRHERETP